MAYSQCFERQMLIYFRDTLPPDFPTYSAFALHIGVTTETLQAWKREHPAFDAVWRECREIQKSRLITGGLSKQYDAGFSKFLLAEMFDFGEENGANTLTVTVEVVE